MLDTKGCRGQLMNIAQRLLSIDSPSGFTDQVVREAEQIARDHGYAVRRTNKGNLVVSVPGREITLAHVIANPTEDLYLMLGLIDASGAIGIFTITPSEAAMIAADVATKSANVSIGFVDRFNGSLVITGDVAAVQSALTEVMNTLCGMMGFASAPITKT